MQTITIQAIPNQKFTVVLDDSTWDISLRTANDCVAASISRNGVVIVENMRAVANMRLIPAEYEEAGNFALVTLNQEIPEYSKFGTSQSLIYISPAELAAARARVDGVITAADFDPIAALPLRFAPQGYTLAP